MKAVIMAGGEGTRLRPLTCGRPKPMVPLVNKPVMEHTIELLRKHGITDVAATLQYMPDMIRDYFEDGSKYGIKMKYYIEQKPLGTAGSVKNAENFLDDTFLVISGDALTDINLESAARFHLEREAMATIILKRVEVPLEYGVVVTDPEGRIIRFLEKPSWSEVFSDTANTGIYILSPDIFNYIKPGEAFDFSKDLFPMLLKDNRRLYGFVTEDYWCDIGDEKAYVRAHHDVLNGMVKVCLPGRALEKGIRIGEGTEVDGGAILHAPCVIGSGCRIRRGAEIGGYSVIGDNSIISGNCGIKRSIVWKNCTLRENVQLRGSIICNNVYIGQGATVFEQSVVGENSMVGERAAIRPSVKIWPDKYIEEGAEVQSNMVWGSKAGRRIFGNRGAAGVVNVDITPEFAAKLGASCGAANGGKGSIGTSFDGSPPAAMIKHALISGLLSSGMEVVDYGRMVLPALRSAVRFHCLDGGVHVGSCPGSGSKVAVEFLDRTGNNIERSMERKVENAFFRDDFNRCEGDCVKSATEVREYMDFYMHSILRDVKPGTLKYKVAFHARSGLVSDITAKLLAALGCETVRLDMDDGGKPGPLDVGWFCGAVKGGGFDLGAIIEDSGEKMTLVDERGRLVTEDMFIALVSLILFRKIRGCTVIVPLSASMTVERLAGDYGGGVVRTKTSPRDVMTHFLGREAREELLEQFTMNYDAAAGLVKILRHMSDSRLKLSELVDMLPEMHMRRKVVECGWDAKGKVIRKLIQENCGGRMETIEGVKVHDDRGWVLVLPDAEKPACSVIGEGVDEEFAEELTNIYVRKVREISRS